MELQAEKTRLFDFYQFQLKNFPQKVALAGKVNGEWQTFSTQEVIEMANKVSSGLLKKGIKPGDKVAIIANNRPEWVITDLAILQIGAINVPIYPTISDDDYAFIFNDSEVKLVFVSDEELLAKARAAKEKSPSVQEIYTFNPISDARHWWEIHDSEPDLDKIEAIKNSVEAKDLATLIYTSGTTGTPKGVMLSHKNVASNAITSKERLPVDSGAKGVSFLPLCHIYERMIIYLYTYTGVSLYFAESMDTIGDDIRDVKPQDFTAVPRLSAKVFSCSQRAAISLLTAGRSSSLYSGNFSLIIFFVLPVF